MARQTNTTVKNRKQVKAREIKQQLDGLQLLGHVVTFNARSGATHTHASVVAALDKAGLDTDLAREFVPRHAFARATKVLQEERVIDVLREDKDYIWFQFTKKHLFGDEWQYSKETLLELNKTTGRIKCDNKELQARAQKELDRCTEARTTSDITQIVSKVFSSHGDLIPLRDQGGVYLVLQEHAAITAQVDIFLQALGGKVDQLPIPKGTQYGEGVVAEKLGEYLQSMVRDLDVSVAQFDINTRRDTLETAAERIKAARVKVEAYASYLQDRSGDLLKAVEASNDKLRQQIDRLSGVRADAPANDPDHPDLFFGHSVVQVIRWMGKAGWDRKQARAALDYHKRPIANATIQWQLSAGRTGLANGKPAQIANLTDAQAAQLSPPAEADKKSPKPRRAKQKKAQSALANA